MELAHERLEGSTAVFRPNRSRRGRQACRRSRRATERGYVCPALLILPITMATPLPFLRLSSPEKKEEEDMPLRNQEDSVHD